MKYLILFSVILISLNGCMGEFGPTYDQYIKGDLYGLCPSGTCICTNVWYDGRIVKSWYDDIEAKNLDSVMAARKIEAKAFIAKIKKYK